VELPDEQVKSLASLPAWEAVARAAEQVRVRTGLSLPGPEIAQMTLEVLTAPVEHGPPASSEEERSRRRADEVGEATRELMNSIGERMRRDLSNPDVVDHLTDHLRRTIARLRDGLPIHNPLTEEVHTAYPALWKATLQAVEELQDSHPALPRLPEAEIAFMTLYVALALQLSEARSGSNPRVVVTCPEGGVTVWMLLSRLRSELPGLEVVDVVSVRELGKVTLDEVDAVVATIPLTLPGVPVITVNPLLQQRDIDRIKRRLFRGGARGQ
jgi:transcriptional antiterminator